MKELLLKALTLSSIRGMAVLATGMAMIGGSMPAMAETSIVVDVATGSVLHQKDAAARLYPASTTKLMTAYLALKALGEGKIGLDSPVVMTRYAASQAPSKMGFEPGSVMRLDNALRMMLVKSANDVAVAIGQSLAEGSIDGFVAMMNAEAAALGMRDTRFINPNGLPGPGQYSSARDLALLGATLRKQFPALADFFATEAISTGDEILKNTNSLLGRFDGADGMKTGYICASGFNLVASATRNGRTLVAVVLGADGPIVRDRLAAELLETGFGTSIKDGQPTIDRLPASSGPVADLSERICSPAARTARANEQKAQEKNNKEPLSPHLSAMKRPPSVVQVSLGGAAGNDTVAAGISEIAAYGIPIPTFRPADLTEAAPASAELRGSGDSLSQSTGSLPVDAGAQQRGSPPGPSEGVAN